MTIASLSRSGSGTFIVLYCISLLVLGSHGCSCPGCHGEYQGSAGDHYTFGPYSGFTESQVAIYTIASAGTIRVCAMYATDYNAVNATPPRSGIVCADELFQTTAGDANGGCYAKLYNIPPNTVSFYFTVECHGGPCSFYNADAVAKACVDDRSMGPFQTTPTLSVAEGPYDGQMVSTMITVLTTTVGYIRACYPSESNYLAFLAGQQLLDCSFAELVVPTQSGDSCASQVFQVGPTTGATYVVFQCLSIGGCEFTARVWYTQPDTYPPLSSSWEFQILGGGPRGLLELRPSASYAWGTSCNNNFTDVDAVVACHSLGYTDNPNGTYFTVPNESAGPIYLDEVGCNSSTTQLYECYYEPSDTCLHRHDVGVDCTPLTPEPTPAPSSSSSAQSLAASSSAQSAAASSSGQSAASSSLAQSATSGASSSAQSLAASSSAQSAAASSSAQSAPSGASSSAQSLAASSSAQSAAASSSGQSAASSSLAQSATSGASSSAQSLAASSSAQSAAPSSLAQSAAASSSAQSAAASSSAQSATSGASSSPQSLAGSSSTPSGASSSAQSAAALSSAQSAPSGASSSLQSLAGSSTTPSGASSSPQSLAGSSTTPSGASSSAQSLAASSSAQSAAASSLAQSAPSGASSSAQSLAGSSSTPSPASSSAQSVAASSSAQSAAALSSAQSAPSGASSSTQSAAASSSAQSAPSGASSLAQSLAASSSAPSGASSSTQSAAAFSSAQSAAASSSAPSGASSSAQSVAGSSSAGSSSVESVMSSSTPSAPSSTQAASSARGSAAVSGQSASGPSSSAQAEGSSSAQSAASVGASSLNASSSALSAQSTAEPSTAEPSTAEPATAEPATAEPATAEPSTAEPSTAEPATAEPSTAEPSTAEPSTAEPSTAEPATAEPATAEPSTAEPSTAEPSTAEPPTSPPSRFCPPLLVDMQLRCDSDPGGMISLIARSTNGGRTSIQEMGECDNKTGLVIATIAVEAPASRSKGFECNDTATRLQLLGISNSSWANAGVVSFILAAAENTHSTTTIDSESSKVGVIVGVVAGLLAVCLLLAFLLLRRRRRARRHLIEDPLLISDSIAMPFVEDPASVHRHFLVAGDEEVEQTATKQATYGDAEQQRWYFSPLSSTATEPAAFRRLGFPAGDRPDGNASTAAATDAHHEAKPDTTITSNPLEDATPALSAPSAPSTGQDLPAPRPTRRLGESSAATHKQQPAIAGAVGGSLIGVKLASSAKEEQPITQEDFDFL